MRAEEALRQAQKMEAVGQLAGGIAHDFNNLLSVIRGYAGLLAQDASLGASVSEAVREMDDAADRATQLTRQLLTFSRKQVMTPEFLGLNEVLGQTGKLLRRVLGEDIALEVELAADLPEIRADRAMLEQVLLNLAVNARDAMPQGGRLRIRSAVLEPSEMTSRPRAGAPAGSFVTFSVSDTGSGIASEDLPRIFEPFFTTKGVGKGTGLGLASAYGIVEQHGGWIEVESTLGCGATFRIFLPSSPRPAAAAPRQETAPDTSGGHETILLVEDEAALRTAACLVLRHYGYRVVVATSGAEALKIWPEHATEIDLLLTDMVMPDGVSGSELASRLQSVRSDLKVIYSSGYSRELAARKGLLEDSFHFLPKPYTPAKLADAVRACLDGKPRVPAAA
jgi:CheY-like chemotaxis protein